MATFVKTIEHNGIQNGLTLIAHAGRRSTGTKIHIAAASVFANGQMQVYNAVCSSLKGAMIEDTRALSSATCEKCLATINPKYLES